ncbi:hypothetical protein AU467_31245 [Mesorhizobium loti]|uniref:Indoleacetamide hydrolase n=1 Tax=Rhizobium loti TaxID=381 RepID=A0A101KNX3_RHILI|nr:hypothetical protein AU467_31245 [Mesorhizobium loti]
MDIATFKRLDAVALAALVRDAEVSPAEVLQAALDVIEDENGALGAVVFLDRAGSMLSAQRVDRSAPLAGVPILIKDNNIDVEGWPTTYSSQFFEGSLARRDSEFVKRLRRAGAILVGKTNLSEFAADWATEPRFRGPTRNPWNTKLSPGGSSGGAASAVAAGMVPVAHGNDLGGSIRIPAALCGLFGLKPSRGLVPVGPQVAEFSGGHNHEFVLTRSVRDSALLLDVLAGPERESRYHVALPNGSFFSSMEGQLPSLRIGLASAPTGIAVDPEITAATERCACILAGQAGSITQIALPHLTEVAPEVELIWATDIACLIERRSAQIGRKPRPAELEPMTWSILERIAGATARDYVAAREKVHAFVRRFLDATAELDILVTPVAAMTAPPLGYFGAAREDFDADLYAGRCANFGPLTELFNLTGQPAASVPVGLSTSGLPIGVQLVAPMLHDDVVLLAARAVMDEVGKLPLPLG